MSKASSIKHSLRTNAMATLFARLLVPFLSVALVVMIARRGGAASLGQYTLLITLFVLGENLKSLGLTTLLVREISRDGVQAFGQYTSLVRIGLCGALVTGPILVAITACTGNASKELIFAAAVISLGLFPSSFALANDALFLALGRATISMYVALAENLLRLFASLAAVLMWHKGVVTLCAIYALTRLFAAVVQQVVIRRRLKLQLPPYDHSLTWQMLRRAPAFLTVFVSPLILFKMDVVLLGILGGDYQVGMYSAAMRLVTVSLIVPDSVLTATFATLSKLAGEENRAEFSQLFDSIVRWLTSALLVASLAGALFAPFLFHLLYGPKFDTAVPVMQTLSWALVPFALNRTLGDSLVACGEQKMVAQIVLIMIAVSAALYFALIPRFGQRGAAWSFFLSVFVFCSLSAWQAVRKMKVAMMPIWLAMAAAVLGVTGFGIGISFAVRIVVAVVVCGVAVASALRPGRLSGFQYQAKRESA